MALKREIQEDEMEKFAPKLAEVSDQEDLYGGDVVELTTMMSEIVDQVEIEVHNLPPPAKKKATQSVSEVCPSYIVIHHKPM